MYVRNLTSDVTEELLKEKFGYFGKLERAKKIKDYGFIHFEEREDALKALESLNNQVSSIVFHLFVLLFIFPIFAIK